MTMAWWDDTFLNEGFATYFGELVGLKSLGANWDMVSNNYDTWMGG